MAATYTKVTTGSQVTTGASDDVIDSIDSIDAKISAGNGINIVRTGKGNDNITAGDGDDFIDAGKGNNTINAGKGNNRVLTGDGNDTITVGAGMNTISSGAGNDTIIALSGNSTINAGIGNDVIKLGGGGNKVVLETFAGESRVTISGFDITKDKLRLGESLMGKTLTFTQSGTDTIVFDGGDLLAVLKNVSGASAAILDTAPLYKYAATELGSFNTTNKNANVVGASINDFGQIAGRYDTAGTFVNQNGTTNVVNPNNIIRQGFVWEKGKLTALTNVGVKNGSSDFGAPNGATVALLTPNVNTISDRGVVVGTGDEVRIPIGLPTDRALVWEPGTSYNKLAINDFGGIESYFLDTNTSKQYVGRNILASGYEKTIVSENGVIKELAALGGDGGTARGINNKGQIVGYVDKDTVLNEEFVNTAAIWNKDASGAYQFKNLGTFGAAQATLRDINDSGQIIGAKSNGLSGTAATSNPFILRDKNHDGMYTANELTNLGSLGGKTGSVNGINSFGTVVGASQTTIKNPLGVLENHAFVWSEGKITDLNSLVAPITYNGANVVLTSATSINNFGDIVATGTFIYKDAVTKKDTAGTRSYELKGLANKIVTGASSNPLSASQATVAKEMSKVTGAVVSSGNSVVKVADSIITPIAGSGIGGSTTPLSILEPVNPMIAATTAPKIGIG